MEVLGGLALLILIYLGAYKLVASIVPTERKGPR